MRMIQYAVACLAVTAAAASGTAEAGARFDAVKARGTLNCGVHTGLAGFGAANDRGVWEGLDVDLCRAVAAAVFGDATKVRYVPLTTQQRFTAVQSGEVDLLSRNTTYTASRDSELGLNFVGVNYFDGQGFMVAKKLSVTSARQLNGATVCVLPGTTTELNLADYFRASNMQFRPVVIERSEELSAAFFAGRCDVLTSDASQLASIRAAQSPNPADYVILPEIISKEPLGPAVAHGDEQWSDVVRWSLMAMIEAEEKGVNTRSIDSLASTNDPTVKRLLGLTPGIGKGLGLDEKWAYNIIKQVGNYGESFERNLGKGSKLQLERGLNDLWTRGGLMYAIPIR